MKKITKGGVYRAHAFEDGARIIGKGIYHFKIVDIDKIYHDGKMQNVYLGRKLYVDISPDDIDSQCFWFDENGIHKSSLFKLRFELKRKINKKCTRDKT